jgi:hypothetical protein
LSEKKYKKEKNRGATSFFFSELNFILVFKLSQQAQIHLWADLEHHAGSPHHHLIRGPLAGLFQVLLHWLLQKPCQTPNKKRLPS